MLYRTELLYETKTRTIYTSKQDIEQVVCLFPLLQPSKVKYKSRMI